MDAQRRQELLTARAERAQAEESAREALADQVLELEAKYVEELGPRGQAFEIANEDGACGEGPIVVKPAEVQNWKAWTLKPGAAPEDAFTLVKSCLLFPTPTELGMLYARRPELLSKALAAVAKLAGAQESVWRGKL